MPKAKKAPKRAAKKLKAKAMDKVKIKRVKRNKKKTTTAEKILAGVGVGSTLMGGAGAVAAKGNQTQFVRTQESNKSSVTQKIKAELQNIFGEALGTDKAQAAGLSVADAQAQLTAAQTALAAAVTQLASDQDNLTTAQNQLNSSSPLSPTYAMTVAEVGKYGAAVDADKTALTDAQAAVSAAQAALDAAQSAANPFAKLTGMALGNALNTTTYNSSYDSILTDLANKGLTSVSNGFAYPGAIDPTSCLSEMLGLGPGTAGDTRPGNDGQTYVFNGQTQMWNKQDPAALANEASNKFKADALTMTWQQLVAAGEDKQFTAYFSNGQHASEIPTSFPSTCAYAYALGMGDTAGPANQQGKVQGSNGQWYQLTGNNWVQTTAPTKDATGLTADNINSVIYDGTSEMNYQISQVQITPQQLASYQTSGIMPGSALAYMLGLGDPSGPTHTDKYGNTYVKNSAGLYVIKTKGADTNTGKISLSINGQSVTSPATITVPSLNTPLTIKITGATPGQTVWQGGIVQQAGGQGVVFNKLTTIGPDGSVTFNVTASSSLLFQIGTDLGAQSNAYYQISVETDDQGGAASGPSTTGPTTKAANTLTFTTGSGNTANPQVGDTWKIQITGAAPNSYVYVNAQFSGSPGSMAGTPFLEGQTDANGNFTLTSESPGQTPFLQSDVGSWTETWGVGPANATSASQLTPVNGGTINFTVGSPTGAVNSGLSINGKAVADGGTVTLPSGSTFTGSIKGAPAGKTAILIISDGVTASHVVQLGSTDAQGNLSFSQTFASSKTVSYEVDIDPGSTSPTIYTFNVSASAAASTTAAITTASLPNAVEGSAYSQSLKSTGIGTGATWSITQGSLPGGLSMNSVGVISGTPASGTAGDYTFTVSAQDSSANKATRQFKMTVNAAGVGSGSQGAVFNTDPVIVNSTGSGGGTIYAATGAPVINAKTLPNGAVSQAYYSSLQITGSDVTSTVTSGALPPGVIVQGGYVTGLPTVGGTYNFTIQVSDPLGRSASQAYTINIAGGDTVSTQATVEPANITTFQGLQMPPGYPASGSGDLQMQADTSSGQVQGASIGSQTYVVKRGDTLGGISKKFYGNSKYWRKILSANPGCLSIPDNTRTLKIGAVLTIPAINQ